MDKDIIFAISTIVALLVGVIVGKLSCKKKPDGNIVIENSSDGERTTIRFILDLELEDLQQRKEVYFKVTKHLS